MFGAIILRNNSAHIQKTYNQVLQRILALIENQIEDPWEKAYLESLVINKYQHETRDEIMLPSRLEKRLMRIYLNRTHIEDPYMEQKAECNRRAQAVLDAPAFQQAFNHVDEAALKNPPRTLDEIKSQIAALEFQRLLCLANSPELWQSPRLETPLEASITCPSLQNPSQARPPASARLPGLRASVPAQEAKNPLVGRRIRRSGGGPGPHTLPGIARQQGDCRL
jgi:hypothetical protein